jgi:Ca-activated chloride channel family protein
MENELDKLSRMTPPKPSNEARARAMALAMQAFDDEKNNAAAPQGTENTHRQSSITTRLWRTIMNGRLLAGSALATLLIVPAAGYLAIHMVNEKTVDLGEVPVLTDKGKDRNRLAGDQKQKTTEIDANAGKQLPQKPHTDNNTVADTTVANNEVADKPAPVAKTETTTAEPVVADEKKADEDQKVAEVPKEAADTGALASGVKPAGELGQTANLTENSENAPADALASAPANVVEGRVMSKKLSGAFVDDGTVAQPPLLQQESGDRFTSKDINPVKSVATDPVSTFSIDVDTASYAYARQSIMSGRLPEADSVRVEEMINYFPYDWKPPEKADQAFKANITVMPTPWNANTLLMHVGIKGYEIQQQEQKPANLVFLIDVSGSMDEPNKLPLLKSAFRLLVNKLKPTDTVSIVVYAGNSGVVLEPTKVSEKQKILDAIDALTPGGSTAGAEGIEAAYKLAEKAFVKDGVNRIFLATDGDFNVGPSSDDELKAMIEAKRKTGIFLSVLGFGTGNYNDALMQTLAQNGNGVAAYIDTLAEAQKTLVQEASASIFPIAKDVKIQVEFNPQKIAEYRLIGYETRALKREDFNNDKVDAGEIGSGHRVTAIYEITPKGSPAVLNDDLRYAAKAQQDASTVDTKNAPSDELAFVKIRYKKPNEDKSTLITMPVKADEVKKSVGEAPADVRFSVAVAAFGQKLKNEDQVSDYSWDNIIKLGTDSKGTDPYGYRAEFLKLVELSKSLKGE